MAINRTILIGNLTRDAEVTYTPGGMAIAKMSIAVNRKVKSGDGWADEVSYFDLQLFGKQAEGLKPYLLKGKKIGVDGYLKQERWEQEGQKRSRVVINANDIELLSPRENSGNNSGNNGSYSNNNGFEPGYGYN